MSHAAAHIVLMRPQRALHLGAVARAMKNFGLSRLTLVTPRIGSWAEAWRTAVHAHDLLQQVREAPDLDTAVADARWVVGTSNRPLPGQSLLTPRQVAERVPERGAPTLVFGDEQSGLNHAELRRCHDLSMIPVAPAQSSLNLAQAVVVYAAELFAAAVARDPTTPTAPGPAAAERANARLLQELARLLARTLDQSAWADKSRPLDAIGELVQPLWRAQLTVAEARAWLVALGRIDRPPKQG